jgi:predicted ribosome quality control (RQC) complex YloA/Tae2 family protein
LRISIQKEGGRLMDVRMEPGDRIVYFEFQCTNEMGDLVRNTLCAELMGRYSNLVLVQNGKIIDALKRVDFEDSDVRQLLPGFSKDILRNTQCRCRLA